MTIKTSAVLIPNMCSSSPVIASAKCWGPMKPDPSMTRGPGFASFNLEGLAGDETCGCPDAHRIQHLLKRDVPVAVHSLSAPFATESRNSEWTPGDSPCVSFSCALIITAAVGLAGCFHHHQAVYAEPIARPPLKYSEER